MGTGSNLASLACGRRRSWALVVCLAGCAGTAPPATDPLTTDTRKHRVVFPPAPARPRVQLLATLSDATSGVTRGAFDRFVTGRTEGKPRPIAEATALGLQRGQVFVCDAERGAIEVVDLRHQASRAVKGRGESRLVHPSAIAFSPRGRRFVGDVGRGGVLTYDGNGVYDGLLEAPEGERVPARARTALATSDEHLFVADPTGHAVLVFDVEGREHQATFTWPGPAHDLFFPVALAPGRSSTLWVADLQRGAVHQFSPRGELLQSLGRRGDGPGEFRRPSAVAVDATGRVFVADERRHDVQAFDDAGRALFAFGGPSEGWAGLDTPTAVLIDDEHLDLFEDDVLTGRTLTHLVLVGSRAPGGKVAVFGILDAPEGEE